MGIWQLTRKTTRPKATHPTLNLPEDNSCKTHKSTYLTFIRPLLQDLYGNSPKNHKSTRPTFIKWLVQDLYGNLPLFQGCKGWGVGMGILPWTPLCWFYHRWLLASKTKNMYEWKISTRIYYYYVFIPGQYDSTVFTFIDLFIYILILNIKYTHSACKNPRLSPLSPSF